MNILITGVHSYIGNHLYAQLKKSHRVTMRSLRDGSWIKDDWSEIDVIIHVAGLAHVQTGSKDTEAYERVNRDLTLAIAKKAKESCVSHFVFLSSSIVYGESKKGRFHIDSTTLPKPSNAYGKSKLDAEKGLELLKDSVFKVAILRLPMVYGPNSKGNYPRLARMALKLPFFIHVNNQRSVLYMDYLAQWMKEVVKERLEGTFFPQNPAYMNTTDLVKTIRKAHGKNTIVLLVFGSLMHVLMPLSATLRKLFGSLTYDTTLPFPNEKVQFLSFEETIRQTEVVYDA